MRSVPVMMVLLLAGLALLARAQPEPQPLPYPSLGERAGGLRGPWAEETLVDTVRSTQFFYNRNFDEAVVLAAAPNASAARQTRLNNVQSVFCADGSFQGWVATSPKDPTTYNTLAASTIAAVAGLYQYLTSAVFYGFSHHLITNTQVVLYRVDDVQYANFTASVNQFFSGPVNSSAPVGPANPLIFGINFGIYYNVYKLQPNGKFCMVSFRSDNTLGTAFPGAPAGPTNYQTGLF